MQNIEKITKKIASNENSTKHSLESKLQIHFENYRAMGGDKELASFFSYCQILWLSGNCSLDGKNLEIRYSNALKFIGRIRAADQMKKISQLTDLLESSDREALIEAFCSFYENKIKKDNRSSLGAFYTPLSYCIAAYKNVISDSKDKSAYDAFCGGGAWLCAFILTRKTKLYKVDAPPVYGTDIDENAIYLARLNTSLILSRNETTFRALCNQIRVANTLYQSPSDRAIVEKFLSACSHVATNPPYGFAVDSKNKLFKTNLDRVPDREVFYYAIDKIRSMLPQNKVAHFLVPNTFLFNLGSKDFKKHLAENFNVLVHDHTQENLFLSATVRTALLSLSEKKKEKFDITYALGFGNKSKKMNDLDFVEGKFKAKDHNSLLSSLETIPLNSIFEVSQGLIPYDKYRGHTKEQIEKRVYHSDKKLGPEYKKELQGKSVSPFSVKWSGDTWIKYGDWLAAPRSAKFFRESRVLIREITDAKSGQILCSYSDQEFYNTPSIINVIFRGEKRKTESSLKTLAVLLSSSVYADHHLKNNPKAMKGVFPKILVNDVRNLPLPANFLSMDLSNIYDRANKMAISGHSTESVLSFVSNAVEQVLSKRKAA
ncbi:N-6 DNA methylase [Bdellovibrio bacteriovorus]|uniref:N-6 DNA methylase n=1 Tax=Bdellovibrio bacteriovorus TaxID=959 RepID=UPI0035A578A2